MRVEHDTGMGFSKEQKRVKRGKMANLLFAGSGLAVSALLAAALQAEASSSPEPEIMEKEVVSVDVEPVCHPEPKMTPMRIPSRQEREITDRDPYVRGEHRPFVLGRYRHPRADS